MNEISKTLDKLRKNGKKALIPFITAGDPSLETTKRLVLEMEKAGASIIELGVPFSDPMADGPTIQASSQRALKNGASLKKILGLVAEIRKESAIPLVLMSYLNPIFRMGISKFLLNARKAGVNGLIIPDMPMEESHDFRKECIQNGIDLIYLIAPTTPLSRAEKISSLSSGYVYYVSLTGVTGARNKLSEDLKKNLLSLRGAVKKPLMVGFGISSPAQAKEVSLNSDGVIIGSAIVKLIEKEGKRSVKKVFGFVSDVNKAMNT